MADSYLFEVSKPNQYSSLEESVFMKIKESVVLIKEKLSSQEEDFYSEWLQDDKEGCFRSILMFDKAMKEGWIEFSEDENQVYIELPQGILEQYPDAGSILAEISRKLLERHIDLVYPIIQAVDSITHHHASNPEVFGFLIDNASDLDFKHRDCFVRSLVHFHRDNPKTIEFLNDLVTNDPDEQLRKWAQEQLLKMENQGGSS